MSKEIKKHQEATIERGISADLKELVIYRLDILPSNKKISIGSEGEFSKSDLIDHVRKEDAIGRQVVDIEMSFLRALKDGSLLEEISASDE